LQAGRFYKCAYIKNRERLCYTFMLHVDAAHVPGPQFAMEFEVTIMRIEVDLTTTFVMIRQAVDLWGLDNALIEKLSAEHWDDSGIGCRITKESVQNLLDALLVAEAS
jgi:hypothetical protein